MHSWDKAAGSYEEYWQEQLRPAQDLLLQRAAIKPGDRVLDVACGTGLVTFRAAEATGPGGPVALAYSRFDAPTREAARADYLASIEAWRSGQNYDVPGEFVIASGSR